LKQAVSGIGVLSMRESHYMPASLLVIEVYW
jgi:hypothetical protein